MQDEAQSSPHPDPPGRKRRLPRLLLLGATLVGTALAYLHFYHHRPVGDGPAGPTVDRGLFASVWSDRPVLLLGLGDSITAGFGASRGLSYFDRMVNNPPDEFAELDGVCLSRVLPNLRALNLALSGTDSLQHLAKQLPRIPQQPADVFGLVVFTTGGNDIIHDYGRAAPREGAMYGATLAQARPWIKAFESRLATMLDHVEACFPGGCAIFLANIYDPTDDAGDSASAGLPAWPDGLAIHREYNAVLARAAAQRPNVYGVDLHGTFLGHGIHCTKFWRATYQASDPHYWYYYNLEDPNNRGYDAIRRLFLNEIAAAKGRIDE